jgi:hypothetical protein
MGEQVAGPHDAHPGRQLAQDQIAEVEAAIERGADPQPLQEQFPEAIVDQIDGVEEIGDGDSGRVAPGEPGAEVLPAQSETEGGCRAWW